MMTSSLTPAKTPQSARGRVWAAILAFLLLSSAAITAYLLRSDSTPTVYHHPDGHFSLNRKIGSKVTPQEVIDHLKLYRSYGTMRLVFNSGTRLADWQPILWRTGEAGVGNYQLEDGDTIFRFHLPGCGDGIHDMNNNPTVIDLSRGSISAVVGENRYDVVILAGASTSCQEIVNSAAQHVSHGSSIEVDSENLLLLHSREEEPFGSGKFLRHSPGFWEERIQPLIDEFRGLF